MEKVYEPASIEKKWYDQWEKNKSFSANKNASKAPFCIIMPPPNVTGRLHMGHALDNTCQDTLIRFKRMKGHKTLWIPGTDHAGIATQSVVEKKIYKEKKMTRHQLGREKFLEEIWKWKNEYGDIIVDQLKKLGVSCDWEYFCFTMDNIPNQAVRKVFCDLYNEGLIYQAERIINWDTVLQSAISDAEVEHIDVKGKFYFIHYSIENSNEKLLVATTRPETLFGDTAVAINPSDPRFKHLIGKKAIVPLCHRLVPIIADEHVDIETGTGCLKVTPGHDFNDFEIGKRHKLPIINILNTDGTFNDQAAAIKGLSVTKGREATIELLQEKELLQDVKDHLHQVGHGERSNSIIEPMVSKQWFLNVKKMSQDAMDDVTKGNTIFFPKSWENTYFSWLKEPKDWCLSRQLWWGHRIPVYYCQSCNHQWASEEAPTECSKCKQKKFQQDNDVLDTWFSSGLWPLSTLGWPDSAAMKKKSFDTFYPTATLVTAYDIIFFWVARMMMMCKKVSKKVPFKHVYIHAIVRDKNGKKMSKSLGNGVDPMDMIEQYGCDAVRFTLAAGSGYNRALNLDPARIEGYRNFMNKIWNAFRFVEPFLKEQEVPLNLKDLSIHEKWILGELNTVIASVNESFDEYRFDDASNAIYSFIYEKLCSWFLELSKNILYKGSGAERSQRIEVLRTCFREILKTLHPIAPFITEELWQQFNQTMLIGESFPEKNKKWSFSIEQDHMNKFIDVVTSVRNLRSSIQLKPKEKISVSFFTDNASLAEFIFENSLELKKLANIYSGEIFKKSHERPEKSIMSATSDVEIFIPTQGLIDLDVEVSRLKRNIEKIDEELIKLTQKLSNQQFVSKAPESVVREVKEKADQLQEQKSSLEASLKRIGN